MIHIDFETRSNCDLKKAGQYVYAADPTTSILCMAYTLQDESEIKIWYYTDPPPLDLLEEIKDGASVCAHNAAFEKAIWREVCVKRLGWPPVQSWNCTLALAASLNLPLGLGDVAKALGLPVEKDDEGRKLMLKMTKITHAEKDTPELLARLGDYCIQDVVVEIAIANRLGKLGNARERKIWDVDQKINDRGVPIDVETARAIESAVEIARERLNNELFELTGNTVKTAKQVSALREWLGGRGCILADLRAGTIRDELQIDHKDGDVARALEIRQMVSAGSVGKYTAMLASVNDDGRARGLFQYGGASATLRWSGRRIQLQNLPRPTITDEGLIEFILHLFREGDLDMIEIMTGDVIGAAKDMIRAMIASKRGLVVSDLAQIELRFGGWVCGQQDLLDDLVAGNDVYKKTAARIYDTTVDMIAKGSPERTVGKIAVLGCQYGMGWMAFLGFLNQYGIDTDDQAIPDSEVAMMMGMIMGNRDALKMFCEKVGKEVARYLAVTFEKMGQQYRSTIELESMLRHFVENMEGERRNAWLFLKRCKICEKAVRGFRDTYPLFPEMWRRLSYAAMETIKTQEPVRVGKVVFNSRAEGSLTIQLPSGRLLRYRGVRIDENEEGREELTYIGSDGHRTKGYGGKWLENICQAGARDVLADALVELDARGQEVIAHVHDEVVVEGGDEAIVTEVMSRTPDWAPGLPIQCETFSCMRYTK